MKPEGSIGLGVAYGFGANLLHVGISFLLSWLIIFLTKGETFYYVLINLPFIGVVQLIYVVPLFFYFKRAGQTRTAKGLVIAASITALLNASCWGVLFGVRP
jgi:hypothetical protein